MIIRIFATLLILNLTVSCTSKPINNLAITGATQHYSKEYTGHNEIHPVIIKVFDENNIYPNRIDIINNEYYSDYIYQTNFGAKVRYTVYISYKNNIINVQLRDFQQYSNHHSKWLNEDRLAFLDTDTLPTSIINRINTILHKQTLYDKVKKQIYSNFLFHYLVIKNLAKSESNNWIQKNMVPQLFNVKVTLSNIQKNNSGTLSNKKYIAEFTNAHKSNLNDNFVIKYYTNNRDYLTLNNQTAIRLQGKILKKLSAPQIAELLISESHIHLSDSFVNSRQ